MKTLVEALLVVAMAAVPGAALAQDYAAESSSESAYEYGDDALVDAQPAAPAPAELPPAPPPVTVNAPAPQVPAGQWIYTTQYGWIWQPYDQAYTNIPADGSYPMVYAYYPGYGWHWLTAPWIYSVGPRPHWGVYGVSRYVWYSRPWFHVPSHWLRHRSHWSHWGHARHHAPAPSYGHHYRHAPPRHHGGHGYGWNGGGHHRGGDYRGGHGHHGNRYQPPSGGHHGGNRHGGGHGHGGGQRGNHGGGVHQARPAGRR